MDYYAGEGVKLFGRGAWRGAICPFHQDSSPSLRVNIETGAFRCMACGARGGEPEASIVTMNQADLGLNLSTKRTRKREFLEEMQTVVPWAELVGLIAPYAPEGKKGRPPFAVESMLRVHFMQQWFSLSPSQITYTPSATAGTSAFGQAAKR